MQKCLLIVNILSGNILDVNHLSDWLMVSEFVAMPKRETNYITVM